MDRQPQQNRQNGRPQDASPANDAAGLTDSVNRLSLAEPQSASPRSASRARFNARDDSPSRTSKQQGGLRKVASSTTLGGDRKASTPSLRGKSSTPSLRSPQNIGPTTPTPSRRASSSPFSPPASNMGRKSPLGHPSNASTQKPDPAAPSAASIASDYFKKEYHFHRSAYTESKTVIIIQDACYGHRYSRPRTSKKDLNSVVERPERIQAGIRGLSSAYVRMGQRHEGGCFAPHPDLNPKSIPAPPFLFRKTDRSVPLNAPPVTYVHGAKWMGDLKTMCDAAGDRLALNGKELIRGRSSGEDENWSNGQQLHEGDLYLCPESLKAFEGALGGVCEAVDSVFDSSSTRRAFVCIRPPGHHCSADDPSGFCWLNNVHVGIAHGGMYHGLTHAAILDFDLHHGDGSQAIAWEQNRYRESDESNSTDRHNKTAIGYFSLHDINSYPCETGNEEKIRDASVCIDNAHGQSVWNVHLESWTNPGEFWELYNNKYSILLRKTREFLRLHTQRLRSSSKGPTPRAAIFLSAGFDASEWEGAQMRRHKVNVPTDFYARFTSDVVRIAEEEDLGVDGRVVSVLEGGYSDRALTSGILSHVSGLADIVPHMHPDAVQNGLSSEMCNRLSLEHTVGPTEPYSSGYDTPTFDPDWWRAPLLDELEALVNPPPPTPVKKLREKPASNYASPTQSHKAKCVTPNRSRNPSQPSSGDSVALPPPLPDVDWATAAHELSKLLIPTDRQTMSCRLDEVNAGVSRDRHARPPTTYPDAMASDGKRMKLRERKPKIPSSALPSRPSSRNKSTRRKTIADVDLPDTSAVKSPENGQNGSRRLSAASSIVQGANRTQESKPKAKGPGRPATKTQPSTSSRPASSVGVNPGDSLAKKPRVSRTPRAPTTKTRTSPRKIPPVPPIPSYNGSPSVSPTTVPEFSKSESHTVPLSANERIGNQDLDSLTTEVKKLSIKLKVPSPEENAAREKKAAEEGKKAVSKGHKNGLTKRTVSGSSNAKSKSTEPAGSDQESVSTPELQKDDPSGEPKMPDYYPNQPFQETRPLTTPGATSPPLSAEPTEQHPNLVMSPSQTPGLCQPSPQPQITIKSPPSIKPTKEDLPHFTPTSAIPFAPAAVQGQPTHGQQNNASPPTSPRSGL